MNAPMYDEPILYKSHLLYLNIWQVVKNYKHQLWNKRWHYHSEIEFLYMQEGNMDIRIQDELHSLGAGDVLVVGSAQPHVTRKVDEDKLIYLVLHFDLKAYLDPSLLVYYRFFSEMDQPFSRLNNNIKTNSAVREELGSLILRLHQEMENKSVGYEIAVSVYVRHILLTLLRCGGGGMEAVKEQLNAPSLRPVIDYVEERLAEKIDMKEISQMMNMSYHYFSKYFKKVMGLNFTDYINIQRIKKAERLLLTEDLGIMQIAESVGITNKAHFYELFRRYNHCSPREYMQKLLSAPNLES